jgi:hypothetical protein
MVLLLFEGLSQAEIHSMQSMVSELRTDDI